MIGRRKIARPWSNHNFDPAPKRPSMTCEELMDTLLDESVRYIQVGIRFSRWIKFHHRVMEKAYQDELDYKSHCDFVRSHGWYTVPITTWLKERRKSHETKEVPD